MPNRRYEAGRRFEYEVMGAFCQAGCTVVRAAGSHGPYDLVALALDYDATAAAERLLTTNAHTHLQWDAPAMGDSKKILWLTASGKYTGKYIHVERVASQAATVYFIQCKVERSTADQVRRTHGLSRRSP